MGFDQDHLPVVSCAAKYVGPVHMDGAYGFPARASTASPNWPAARMTSKPSPLGEPDGVQSPERSHNRFLRSISYVTYPYGWLNGFPEAPAPR